MKCPNCGSENCQYVATTETHGKSFSVSIFLQRWEDTT